MNLLKIQTLNNSNAPQSAVAATEFLSKDENQIYNVAIGTIGMALSIYGMLNAENLVRSIVG